jgi:hypothetical protein
MVSPVTRLKIVGSIDYGLPPVEGARNEIKGWVDAIRGMGCEITSRQNKS